MAEALLRLKGLGKDYLIRHSEANGSSGRLMAVDHIDLEIKSGETLGLVGESGCGKTTLGKMICRLENSTRGQIWFKGQDITDLSGAKLRQLRSAFQPVFQDPFGSLNPRLDVWHTLQEPLQLAGNASETAAIEKLLEQVGMGREVIYRYPHQLSGGQRQRIGIARALALKPELLVADEPVSSLDVSIQAQILNLFMAVQQAMKLTLLFISHDLRVISHVSDRVVVMYGGRIMETADVAELFQASRHPYVWALLNALPQLAPGRGRKRAVLEGEISSPINPLPGCRFYSRCRYHAEKCRVFENTLLEINSRHQVACCRWQEIDREK